jgi:hypothetical protein
MVVDELLSSRRVMKDGRLTAQMLKYFGVVRASEAVRFGKIRGILVWFGACSDNSPSNCNVLSGRLRGTQGELQHQRQDNLRLLRG